MTDLGPSLQPLRSHLRLENRQQVPPATTKCRKVRGAAPAPSPRASLQRARGVGQAQLPVVLPRLPWGLVRTDHWTVAASQSLPGGPYSAGAIPVTPPWL